MFFLAYLCFVSTVCIVFSVSHVNYSCVNYLQETLHNHNGNKESTGDAEALENGSSKQKTVQKSENLFMNWPLLSSIIVYCVCSLHDIAYQEVNFLFLRFKMVHSIVNIF